MTVTLSEVEGEWAKQKTSLCFDSAQHNVLN